MNPARTVKGKARLDLEPHQLQRGEWTFSNNAWYARCPDGGIANLSNHEVRVEEDGALTVSPSIEVKGGSEYSRHVWHGYLERGVWRDA